MENLSNNNLTPKSIFKSMIIQVSVGNKKYNDFPNIVININNNNDDDCSALCLFKNFGDKEDISLNVFQIDKIDNLIL